jgi:hypothetical protein
MMIERRRKWVKHAKRQRKKWIIEIPEETAKKIGITDLVLPFFPRGEWR